MRRHHRLLVAAGLLAPACSPAPAAHRGSASSSANPPAEAGPDATAATTVATSAGPAPTSSAGVGTPVEGLPPTPAGPTTTVTFTVPTTPATTTTLVLPEQVDEDLTDEEWWEAQPGFVSGACGGSLPPCSVMRRESGGDPTAVNATGCGGRGCFGKWQFDPRTSRGLGYAATMDQYPESVQDDAARALWAGGRGCSHWGAC